VPKLPASPGAVQIFGLESRSETTLEPADGPNFLEVGSA